MTVVMQIIIIIIIIVAEFESNAFSSMKTAGEMRVFVLVVHGSRVPQVDEILWKDLQ